LASTWRIEKSLSLRAQKIRAHQQIWRQVFKLPYLHSLETSHGETQFPCPSHSALTTSGFGGRLLLLLMQRSCEEVPMNICSGRHRQSLVPPGASRWEGDPQSEHWRPGSTAENEFWPA
jgi:hypothetical protein